MRLRTGDSESEASAMQFHNSVRRISRLKASADLAVRAAAYSDWFDQELDHWCKPLLIGNEPANSPAQEKFAWTVDLYGKTDGAGLQTASEVPYVHSWVGSGNALMSGHKYCAAIALRAGALPCAEWLARQTEQTKNVQTVSEQDLVSPPHLTGVPEDSWTQSKKT